MNEQKRFFGKYRGTVVNNIDPESRARLLCLVPDVLGLTPSGWCECCAPLAGPVGTSMGVHLVPPIGAGVWVEFEQGDPNYPIWSGCRFGALPEAASQGLPISPSIILETAAKNQIVISDLPGPTGGIILKSTTGVSLIINDTGIYLQNGLGAKLTLIGPSIDMNNQALTVT